MSPQAQLEECCVVQEEKLDKLLHVVALVRTDIAVLKSRLNVVERLESRVLELERSTSRIVGVAIGASSIITLAVSLIVRYL